MSEHKRLVDNIRTRMAFYVNDLRIGNDLDYFDENKEAEYFFRKPLSLLFDADVTNVNSGQRNFPGIDLADRQKRICFQITSTHTKRKVQHTLDEFLEHELDREFDRLIVLIVTADPPPKCDGLKFTRGFDFNVKRDVWNVSRLVQEFAELPADRRHLLREFADYLERELPDIKVPKPRLVLPLNSALQGSGFVGREPELEEIRSRFAGGDRLVVLSGLGGMGKTELAVRYARGKQAYFARFDTDLVRTLANMALGIRPRLPDEALGQDERILADMVLSLLEQSEESDLLILDNADGKTGVLADLLADPLFERLRSTPLRILLTTRSDWDDAVRVGPMPEEPLFAIFRRHGAVLEDGEKRALIREVNGHTMTIDLIARILNGKGRRKVTAGMLLEDLRKHALPEKKYRDIAAHYRQSPGQAQIYQHLSVVFDVSDMSDTDRAVMGYATLLPEGGMDCELFDTSIREAELTALDRLLESGWLEARNGLLTIHPVIRLVCLTELKPTDESCEDFLVALFRHYDKTDYQPAQYRQMAELLTNASDTLADTRGAWALNAGVLWAVLSAFASALECSSRARARIEAQSPPDIVELATAWNNAGNACGNLGDHHRALEYKLKALELREQSLPPEHPNLASSYNDLGVTHSYLGDYQRALEYKGKAMEIMERTLPPEHPELAIAYNNVGVDYGNLGDHRRALEYLMKALQIREKVLSPEHPDLASIYDNIGISCKETGDYPGALEYMRKALQIREKIHPPEHPEVAASYDNLGLVYSTLGDHHKALEHHLKALELRKKVLPPKHPQLATSFNNVGIAYGDMGERHTALEYKRKALELMETIFPPEHPVLASYCDNVGLAYGELGEHQEALKYKLRALKIMEKVLPPDHPDLALCYGNVGNTYSDLGDHEKEMEYKLRSLELMERCFPPEHPYLASACNNLALAYRELGDLSTAAQYMRRAADVISRSSLPEDHPNRTKYSQWADQLEQEANAPKRKKQSWIARLFGKT